MQAQMALNQAVEQYSMLDFANITLEQCWDICYDRNLTRDELASGDIPDTKLQRLEACARKCTARHFEILDLMMESREQRAKEIAQGLPPGSLSA